MKKLSAQYLSVSIGDRKEAQMIKNKNGIFLRIKNNDKLILDISFEDLYDMIRATLIKEYKTHTKDAGLLRRFISMTLGEYNLDTILKYLKKNNKIDHLSIKEHVEKIIKIE